MFTKRHEASAQYEVKMHHLVWRIRDNSTHKLLAQKYYSDSMADQAVFTLNHSN